MTTGAISRVKVLVMDVDGTLTDGTMTFVAGEQIKSFNVMDGLGIRSALAIGLDIAWVTGNTSETVAERAAGLRVKHVYQASWNKRLAIEDLQQKQGYMQDEIAFIGDDLNDIPAFEASGVTIAVANACDELKEKADFVTTKEGGKGACREAIELVLKSQGRWDDAISAVLSEFREEDESHNPLEDAN